MTPIMIDYGAHHPYALLVERDINHVGDDGVFKVFESGKAVRAHIDFYIDGFQVSAEDVDAEHAIPAAFALAGEVLGR